MGSEALIDFAGMESAVETPVVDSVEIPSVETSDSGADAAVETPAVEGSEPTEESEQKTESTIDKTSASKEELPGTEKTPQEIRRALKAFKDASPSNAEMVKQLHGSFERHLAYKNEFPTVQDAKNAKAFIESIGGEEGYSKLNESIDAVKATDELLYSADKKLAQNVFDDMKAAGKAENYGKVVANFIDNLKVNDADAYYNTFKPHFFNGLKESRMDVMLNSLTAALGAKDAEGKAAPDVKSIASLVQNMNSWYKDIEAEEQSRTKEPEVSVEQKKFLEEKAAFEKTKAEDAQAKASEWENSVASTADNYNNTSLGKALQPFLKMPYFKDFPRDSKMIIGSQIKANTYEALKNDPVYQRQMSALWKGGNTAENNAKIQKFHASTVDAIANRIVTTTIQKMYPGYAKGGAAQGRVAAAAEKKAADTKAGTASVTNNKPIYVPQRPTNLIRETVKVGGREYGPNDLQMMQIAGRGFVRTTDGKSVRLITWRKA